MNKLEASLARIAAATESIAQALAASRSAARVTQSTERRMESDQGNPAPSSSPDLRVIADGITRIADQVAPQPGDIVGTPYVAQRLGCTTVWVAQLIRQGGIPKSCMVEGTGKGKPWKFHRRLIDEWIKSR